MNFRAFYNKIKKILNNNIDIVIVVLVLSFSFFVFFNHAIGSGILNYIDHKFPFDFQKISIEQTFAWSDYIFLGFNQSTSLTLNLPYNLFFTLVQSLIKNQVLINRLEHVIPVFSIIYFTYLWLTSLFSWTLSAKEKLYLLLTGTFFLTCIMNTSLLYTGISQQVFAFSFVPLYLYSIHKIQKEGKLLYILPIIISLLMLGSYSFPYALLSIVLILLILLSTNDRSLSTKIKDCIIFLVSWVLVNFYWFLPFLYSTFVAPPYRLLSNLDRLKDVLNIVSTRYTLDQLFKLSPNFRLIRLQNNDISGYNAFFSSNLVIVIGFIPLLLLFYWYWQNRDNKFSNFALNTKTLLLTILVVLFLAKGLSLPAGMIYDQLYEKSTFFKMFRDPFKWMVIVYFCVIALSANLLIQNKSKLIRVLFLLFIFVNLFPWFNYGLMDKLKSYNVPQYYFDFKNYYLSQQNISDGRALIAESKLTTPGYTSFKFDPNIQKISSNIVKFISPIPIVDQFSNGGGISYEYLIKKYKTLTYSDSDIKTLQDMGITHIINQNDVVKPAKMNYTDSFFNKRVFGQIEVLELKKQFLIPKINLVSYNTTNTKATLAVKKIDPSRYEIEIKNLKSKADLNFLYTYDSNWKLLEGKTLSCETASTFEPIIAGDHLDNRIIECKDNQFYKNIDFPRKFMEIGFISKKSFFDDSHQIHNRYANSWSIDPTHMNGNQFVRNDDGTYNLNLILYNRVQSYLYLGIMVSLPSIVAIVFYWFLATRRRRA